jgi:7-keto-8-aminopelargonate synthetase-like enzyme
VAPCVVSAGLAALDLLDGPEGEQLRATLRDNVSRFRQGMAAAGYAGASCLLFLLVLV